MKTLNRTHELRPLVLDCDTDMSDTILVDFNLTRPAVILLGKSLKIGGVTRMTGPIHAIPSDPGLGAIFDGLFLPKIKFTASHHDLDRASILAMGTCHVQVGRINADTGVVFTPAIDGSYGVGSTLDCSDVRGCRFGYLAAGQKNLVVLIGCVTQALYPADPNEGPGHAGYHNECRKIGGANDGEYLRVNGAMVRIGKIRTSGSSDSVRADHVAFKCKGSYGVDFECRDIENPCGFLDLFGTSGTFTVSAKHTGVARNPYFAAFRVGGIASFGPADGKPARVMGTMDLRLAPDQGLQVAQVETPLAQFDADYTGCADPVVWPGCSAAGLLRRPRRVAGV